MYAATLGIVALLKDKDRKFIMVCDVCREGFAFFHCTGWHSTTNRKKLYMSGRFYTVQKKISFTLFRLVGKRASKNRRIEEVNMYLKKIIYLYNLAQDNKDRIKQEAVNNMKRGGKGLTIDESSKVNMRKKLAEYCGISEDSYRKLDKIMKSNNIELIRMLEENEITINRAYKALSDDIVAEWDDGLIGSYIFYLMTAGEQKELFRDALMFNHEPYLETVPKYLHKKFIMLYKECQQRYCQNINQRQNNTTGRSNLFGQTQGLDLKAWKVFRRDLFKIYHPDNGGNVERFEALQKFDEELQKIFKFNGE